MNSFKRKQNKIELLVSLFFFLLSFHLFIRSLLGPRYTLFSRHFELTALSNFNPYSNFKNNKLSFEFFYFNLKFLVYIYELKNELLSFLNKSFDSIWFI